MLGALLPISRKETQIWRQGVREPWKPFCWRLGLCVGGQGSGQRVDEILTESARPTAFGC